MASSRSSDAVMGVTVIQGGIHQGGAVPEQDVAAIPGCAATDLLRDAAGTAEKSERAVSAARVLKTDGADGELVIPVRVVCGRELLESVFLQNGGVGGIGSLRRGAFLGGCAQAPAGEVGGQQRRSGGGRGGRSWPAPADTSRDRKRTEAGRARSIRTCSETRAFLPWVSNWQLQLPLGRPVLCARRTPLRPLMYLATPR